MGLILWKNLQFAIDHWDFKHGVYTSDAVNVRDSWTSLRSVIFGYIEDHQHLLTLGSMGSGYAISAYVDGPWSFK